MGWFKERYASRVIYHEPERYSPTVARVNRLNALLERERRFADVPNFTRVKESLSQAQIDLVRSPTSVVIKSNDQKAIGHKLGLITSAINKYKIPDFSDPDKRQRYQALRRQQEALRNAKISMGGRKKSEVSGSDKRRFDPTGKTFAVNRYGTQARTKSVPYAWIKVFANPGSVIPCVQRHIRREVMFAKGYGGRGYRVKHRRTWMSGVPC